MPYAHADGERIGVPFFHNHTLKRAEEMIMVSKTGLVALSVFCLLSIIPACARNDNKVGTVSPDGGGPDGGGSGGTSGLRDGQVSLDGAGTVPHEDASVGAGAVDAGRGSDAGGTSGMRDGQGSPESAVCNQFAAAAAAQYQSILDSTSPLACQSDSDCTLLHLQSLNCFAACGSLVGAAAASSATAAATGVCDLYFGAGCPEIRLACPSAGSVCDQGQCRFVTPGSALGGASDGGDASGVGDGSGQRDGMAAPDGISCQQLAQEASAQFQSYLDSTSSLTCQSNADCTLLHPDSLICFAPCGRAVATAKVSAVTPTAATACDGFHSAGCSARGSSCPVTSIVCDNGRCAAVYGRLPDAGTGG